MTKTDIEIYRGLKEKFDPEVHVGFFITTDTGELLLGDQSLGQTISGWEINDGVLILKLNTGRDIRVTFPEATETVKGLLSASDKAQLNALQANLDSKVDKVTGKSLLADSEIEKLAGLPNSTELTNSIATAKAAGDNAQSDLNAHKQNKSNPHEVTKAQVGLGNVTNDAQVKRSEMGVANGVATLDADGKVPASQLPSYVDDIIDVYATYSKSDTGVLSNVTLYLDAAHTQLVTGEAGKIYQNIADGEPQYQFRWTGTIFSQTGASSLILGEVTGTAYDGAKGKANADNIAKIKGTSLSHIKDAAPVTTAADKVSINYECYEGNQYGAAGTDHTADIPAATTSKAGVMSATDKTKLEDLNSKLVVADEEDVTAVEGKIKFKDRDTTNGMGYKILRLPENGILTQDMINQANTIYEIRYNFDLNGETITIPENCVLKFEGGKLSNGTITFNNTLLKGKTININCFFNGFINNKNIYAKWFNLNGNGTDDDSYKLVSLFKALTNGSNLYLENNKIYLHGDGVIGDNGTGNSYSPNPNDSSRPLIDSAHPVDLGRDIRLMLSNLDNVSIYGNNSCIISNPKNGECRNNAVIWIETSQNINIYDLTIDGNKDNRKPIFSDYNTGKGEADRHNIVVFSSQNVNFHKVSSNNSIHNGFSVLKSYQSDSTFPSYINFYDCKADNSYKNGIGINSGSCFSIIGGEYSNSGKTFGINPKAAICLEVEIESDLNTNCLIRGVYIHDCTRSGISVTGYTSNTKIENSHIQNAPLVISGNSKNTRISNCSIQDSICIFSRAFVDSNYISFTDQLVTERVETCISNLNSSRVTNNTIENFNSSMEESKNRISSDGFFSMNSVSGFNRSYNLFKNGYCINNEFKNCWINSSAIGENSFIDCNLNNSGNTSFSNESASNTFSKIIRPEGKRFIKVNRKGKWDIVGIKAPGLNAYVTDINKASINSSNKIEVYMDSDSNIVFHIKSTDMPTSILLYIKHLSLQVSNDVNYTYESKDIEILEDVDTSTMSKLSTVMREFKDFDQNAQIGEWYIDSSRNAPYIWNGIEWIDPAEDSIKWRTIE